jgi:hypothetical protein
LLLADRTHAIFAAVPMSRRITRVRAGQAAGLLFGMAVLAWSLPSRAFDSLFKRLDPHTSLAAAFPASESHADVEDGFLLGVGMERLTHLPDGTLRVERTRKYTRIRNPDTGKLANLPEPWEISANLIVQPSLRMVLSEMRFKFKRSGDTVFPDYKFSEHEAGLFDHDHSVTHASANGQRITHQEFNHGKLGKSETYDYPPQSVPVELIGLLLSAAVQRHVDQFDFQLLVPDGSTHGVRAQTHRTRDVRPYAKGYRIPPRHLLASEPLAVVDLRLSSPIKYLFYPHHFYLAFSVREPWKLMMLWGGDPDKNLQAFRSD